MVEPRVPIDHASVGLAQARPNYTGHRCGGSKAAVHGNKAGVVVQPDHCQNMISIFIEKLSLFLESGDPTFHSTKTTTRQESRLSPDKCSHQVPTQ